jgi:hypothetical protein
MLIILLQNFLMPDKAISLPVFYGTLSDFTRIKLDFINAQILVFKSKLCKKNFKRIMHPELFEAYYKNICTEPPNIHLHEDENYKQFILVPIDINQPFEEKNWNHFFRLIQALYPSDFALVKIFEMEPFENFFRSGSFIYYGFRSTSTGNYFSNFLGIYKKEYSFVNSFLRNYFVSSQQLEYLQYILSVYTNSLQEPNPTFRFLSLIICLEVTVDSPEQLTYRLKRNVALLCGEDKETCQWVYDNVGNLYSLRSDIVHGTIKPNFKNFQGYYEYLRNLVARLIRELIIHNIPDLTTLNRKLNTLGFGQNRSISHGYRFSDYPISGNLNVLYTTLIKYKR